LIAPISGQTIKSNDIGKNGARLVFGSTDRIGRWFVGHEYIRRPRDGLKLLTQARIRPDQAVWDLITSWVDDFDSWAIADHACMAGQKRIVTDPIRLDQVETWITSDHMWRRRAAFVITLPYTKQNFPKPHEFRCANVCWLAAKLADDHDWFIQKAIAWWVRDLSRHDGARAENFLNNFGDALKPFARKEAARHMNKDA
jgi:3-methyladenine DNA glycosylase AlkD